MSELSTRFAAIRQAMSRCVESSIADRPQALGRVHQIDEDVRVWIKILPTDVGNHLNRGRRELAHAEHAVASGLYGQAFASLRLFLEISFAAIHFSANEYERRRWLSDRADFSWSRVLDEESGVLSKSFVQEFNAGLAPLSTAYAAKAAKTYRYCSQFVHGKASASWRIPDEVGYDSQLLDNWCEHALDSGDAVLFALIARFGESLQEDEVIDAVVSRFSRHPEIRNLIGHASDA